MTSREQLPNPLRFRVAAWLLLAVSAALLALLIARHGLGELDPPTAAGFVAFGLLVIICGFPHPYFGHVSFDRVAQFSTLLILGPLAAALVSAVASLLYPWGRLRHGEPVSRIVDACAANAGMMILIILGAGGVYAALGGQWPLLSLDARALLALLGLSFTAHLVNDALMAGLVWLRGGDVRRLFGGFALMIEGFSFLVAFLVALIYNQAEPPVIALMAIVLGVFMVQLRQLGHLQQNLESLVQERTARLARQAEELDRLAKCDGLTGLHNRRYFDERIAEEVSRAHRYGRPLAVVLADVDHFKHINDRWSHAIGDAVLRELADTLRSGCRDTDLVARYGGEEFVLAFPEADAATAAALCERLRARIADRDWSGTADGLITTVSFGVAGLEADGTPASLLRAADVNLYRAKHAGRNRVIADRD